MRDFVFMIDVNGDMDPEYAREHDIKIMPQYYHFNDGVIYGDEMQMPIEGFFARLKSGDRAYSMGCNPDRVHGIMEKALQQDKDIIVLMASSECSGSYNTVRIEAEALMEEYEGSRIHVIDTFLECVPIALLTMKGVELKEEGKSFDEIVDILEKKKSKFNILFVVDDLSCLVRGGRLSPISGMVGSVLNIKPVLTFVDGKIEPLMKCRGKKAAKAAITEMLKEKKLDKKYFAGGHTVNYDEAHEYAENLAKELGVENMGTYEINPTIGAHTGGGAFGIAYCETDD